LSRKEERDLKVLFVCEANVGRSRWAEHYLKKRGNEEKLNLEVKSAGILAEDPESVPLTQKLLDWADIVLVMEERMREKILKNFKVLPFKIFSLEIYERDENWGRCLKERVEFFVYLFSLLKKGGI